MKVGILSITYAYNFGATLQTIALFRVLRGLGHDPIVIDYWPFQPRRFEWFWGWGFRSRPKDMRKHIRGRLLQLRHLGRFKRKYNRFKRSELQWTAQCADGSAVEEVLRGLDAVVVGSDQVWNLKYFRDPIFQLDGLDSFAGRRISYAACCGDPAQECAPWTGRALRRFHAVGVRNRFTAEWIRRCTRNCVMPEVVCDPTLLVDNYPRVSLELPERYIAIYRIGEGDPVDQRRMIQALRGRYGNLPVVYLMPTGSPVRSSERCGVILWTLNPYEWIEAIRRASAVYTDSYHAILFSLRNRVPVLATYSEEVRAPRLIELRDSLRLDDWILSAKSNPPVGPEPDWDFIAAMFEASKNYSEVFLRESLGDLR